MNHLNTIQQPSASKKLTVLETNNDKREDFYFWMNQRDEPGVLAYLEEENAYYKAVMEPFKDTQDQLYKEMLDRVVKNDQTVPYFDDGIYFYVRYEDGKEYPIYCMKRESLDSAEEIMLDVNILAAGLSYCNVAGLALSPDKKILAYGIDTVGRRQYNINFRDLHTGDIKESGIINTSGEVVWSSDSAYIWYVQSNEQTLRSEKLFRHAYNTPDQQDELIYFEEDEAYYTSISVSKSRDLLLIGNHGNTSDEFWYLNRKDPLGQILVFQRKEKDLEYDIDHLNDKFYIKTNYNAANFRLMVCELNQTEKQFWKEIIPHDKDVLLEGFDIFDTYLALQERKDGLSGIRIYFLSTHTEKQVRFDDESYVAYLGNTPDPHSNKVRINYSSLNTPSTVYDFDVNTGSLELLKQQEVPGGYNPKEWVTKRIYAIAYDGTKVPVSIVYHKDRPVDGSGPLLLYGYGSYGHSIDPIFSPTRLSLLERGFAYAIAHIRGGDDLGRYWYEDGKLLNKTNTFLDFIACGEYLVKERYVHPGKLYAMGGSAGGLLMGAVINMNPGLWRGIVAAVPFVDALTTMLDDTIPLTVGEYDEWGNPNESVFYEYMKSYSPYDNIKAQMYPAMLVTTGYHDSQVQYWEPAKWVAKLRAYKTDSNPLLFHCDMETGHSGASGRFSRLKEIAMEYNFILALERQ